MTYDCCTIYIYKYFVTIIHIVDIYIKNINNVRYTVKKYTHFKR